MFLREIPGAISDLPMRRTANRTGRPGEVLNWLDTPREGVKKEMNVKKERDASHFILSLVFSFLWD